MYRSKKKRQYQPAVAVADRRETVEVVLFGHGGEGNVEPARLPLNIGVAVLVVGERDDDVRLPVAGGDAAGLLELA